MGNEEQAQNNIQSTLICLLIDLESRPAITENNLPMRWIYSRNTPTTNDNRNEESKRLENSEIRSYLDLK